MKFTRNVGLTVSLLGLLACSCRTSVLAQQIPIEVRFLTVEESFFERVGLDFDIEMTTSGPLKQFAGTGLTAGVTVPFATAGNVNVELVGSFTNFASDSGTQFNVPNVGTFEFTDIQFFRFGPQFTVSVPLGNSPFELITKAGVSGGFANTNARRVQFDNSKNQFINPVAPDELDFLFTLSAGGGLRLPTRFGAIDLNISFTADQTKAFTGRDQWSQGLSIGFAILSDIEVFYLLQAAQGDARSNVLTAPVVR